ncbi:MAG: MATE family efflux transporter [Candidatus Ornithomonoglobus sp.]
MSRNTQNSSEQYDRMINTSVHKLIIKLSVPTIISMMITNIYNLADTAFVGKLGNSASGAVGVVFGFMSILQAVGFLFGQGAGSIISRRLGQRNNKAANETASTAFFLSFFLAILISVICFLTLDKLVIALGSTDTIAPYAKTYIAFILLTAPFMVTGFTMNNILRYEGKAMLGMIGLMTGGILNIFGDAVFMFGFKMGIAGAGLSTAISQFISFCILLSMFLRGKTECVISIRHIRLKMNHLFDITATGLPSLLRQGLNSITTILLNTEAAVYGDAAVAAMSIISRITFFVFSVALGIGQGFQPVGGFNYGAGKYGRVRKAYKFTIFLAEGLMLIMTAAVFIGSDHLIGIFRNDIDVISIGTRALRLQCIAQLLLPFCMATEMLMQSTGKKLGASILSATRSGIFFIPALLILARLRGLSGIQEAQPSALVLSVIPTVYLAVHFFKALPEKDKNN